MIKGGILRRLFSFINALKSCNLKTIGKEIKKAQRQYFKLHVSVNHGVILGETELYTVNSLSKTETIGAGTNCSSWKGLRLIESLDTAK